MMRLMHSSCRKRRAQSGSEEVRRVDSEIMVEDGERSKCCFDHERIQETGLAVSRLGSKRGGERSRGE